MNRMPIRALILCLACSLVCLLAAPTQLAQQQRPSTSAPSPQMTGTAQASPTPPEDNEDDVVRITTNLVQLDVVVTDKEGRQVTDLRPEEFELYEDGKQQPITSFSYVNLQPATGDAATTAPPRTTAPAAAPSTLPRSLRPEQVRRTVALVVDDLGLSYQSMAFVRRALKKFVDEQMQPNDLVAIIRTRAGMGALQQFTSDKRLLYNVIERIRWYPLGRGGISAFAALEDNQVERELAEQRAEAGITGRGGDAGDRDSAKELDEFREELFSVGTLGALNYIVRGLRELPGRKSVVMFSEGFSMTNTEGTARRLAESLRRLTDLANRASVVVYTVDPRGLQPLGLQAEDKVAGIPPEQMLERLSERRSQLFDTQSGLDYLSRQTGGFSVRNTNDVSDNLLRVLKDQQGFYLIGYRPSAETFDPVRGRSRFHNVLAKVKRPGVRVRSRNGFYGFTEEEVKQTAQTRDQQIRRALLSPFSSGGVRLRMTSLFGNADEQTSFVSALLHVDPQDISFTEEAEGWQKAVIDVWAVVFGEDGAPLEDVTRTETIRVRGESYQTLRRNGLVYALTVPVKKPGAYQLRAAIRDASAQRVGSASQFIEVPDLKKDRLALSGIVLVNSPVQPSAAGQPAPPATPATPAAPDAAASSAGDKSVISGDRAASSLASLDAAVRRFRRGASIDYYYQIYNARLDSAGRPQLQTQFRLFREGREVVAGKPMPFNAGGQTDMKRLRAGSRLRLVATALPPGEYVLQIIVTDLLAPDKRRAAAQWIDFEIVE